MKLRIIFLGSADFGIPALSAIRDAGHEIAGIVTTPPKPKGRGLFPAKSPVSRYAEQNGISPVLAPEHLNSEKVTHDLASLQADLFLVVAFRILPPAIFSLPRLGTFNIHASLLPRYRGAAPIQRAIQAGEKETGITIFRIDAGIDTGTIINRRKTSIGPTETTPELYGRLQMLGAEAIVESLKHIERGSVAYQKQDPAQVCPAPRLKKNEAHINWNSPAHRIFNTIRAFKPFPGTHTFYKSKKLNIEWAMPNYATSNHAPGTVCALSGKGFSVQCRESTLDILEVKPEGRKKMSAHAFLQGRSLAEGYLLQ
ncbi:MAG: methionyl-tRNA formyltransferase [Chitinivibrionales bacterium]|nr:methionyl-tRNA formyltransferase [Chitinivibrionales bacterium]